jgi:DNA-binding NarL/FixJ family response regulator
MIRALLVDDHTSYREALAFMLEARTMMTGIDVAIVDLGLIDGNGTDLIIDFIAANPQGIALVLTARDDRREFARAVEAGATGLLSKTRPIREIIDCVYRAAGGAVLLSPTETIDLLRLASQQRQQELAVQQSLGKLTRREREILVALGQGLNDREIGERLSISTETVRTHFVNILGKLNLTSRLQALIFAIRHGFVTID